MKYLKSYRDRHGKQRHYIRKAGFKPFALKMRFGTKAFAVEYEQGMERLEQLPPRKPRPRKPRPITPLGARRLRRGVLGVYLVKAGERLKIGYSSDVRSRMQELQVGCHEVIALVGLIRGGTPETEKALHAEFAEYRVHGEWFDYGPRLSEFAALVRTNRAPNLANLGVAA